MSFRVFEAIALRLIQVIIPGLLFHFLFHFLFLLVSDSAVEVVHDPLGCSLLVLQMLLLEFTDLLAIDLEFLLLLGDDLVVLLGHFVVCILFHFLLFVKFGLVSGAEHFVQDAGHSNCTTEQNHGHLECRVVCKLVHDESSTEQIHEDDATFVEGHRLELRIETDDAIEVDEVVYYGEACDGGEDVAWRVND